MAGPTPFKCLDSLVANPHRDSFSSSMASLPCTAGKGICFVLKPEVGETAPEARQEQQYLGWKLGTDGL